MIANLPINITVTKRKIQVPVKDQIIYYFRINSEIVATLSYRKRKDSEEYAYWLTWSRVILKELFGSRISMKKLKNDWPKGLYCGKNWTTEELVQYIKKAM